LSPHSTLAENVAAALRHAIFHGAYVCGERLVELSIAREMNVSQNTVRDALRLLEQDGLVIKRARLGTHVRAYSPDEAVEIYELWAAVEGQTLRRIANCITPQQLANLRQVLEQYREQKHKDSRFQLHAALTDIAGRPRTAELLHHLRNQARLLENLRPPCTPEQCAMQCAVYESLLDALTAREVIQAQRILGDYLIAEGESMAAVLTAQP
jgi:DNA-binding GntR family transcriptional regulator